MRRTTIIKSTLAICSSLALINFYYASNLGQPDLDTFSSWNLLDTEEGGIPNNAMSKGEELRAQVTGQLIQMQSSEEGGIPNNATSKEEELRAQATGQLLIQVQYGDSDTEYERLLHEALTPLPEGEAKTGNYFRSFMAGLCNQYFRFLGVTFLARQNGFDQILDESVAWKDTFGTFERIQTSKLWDIVHWNSFYPILPRFVRYEKGIHRDLDVKRYNFTIDGNEDFRNALEYNVAEGHNIWASDTYPPPFGLHPNQAEIKYKHMMKAVGMGNERKVDKEYEMYKTILRGALRPHPFLQKVVDKTAAKLGGEANQGYMVIHLRVEPDMTKQRNCWLRKVYYVDNITDMVYREFPEPPVQTVLIVFARALIENTEKIAQNKKRKNHHDNVNRHNLDKINDLVRNGMWGGRVKVVEAGSGTVEEAGNPYYKHYSNIAGGIVNFFLAVQAKILVGTEVSTYSTLSINTRFFRGVKENFFYRPEGLHWVTPPNVTKAVQFIC